jgi:hypothetical protein
MASAEPHTYVEPLNNEHRLNIGIAIGLTAAIRTLHKDAEKFGRLPGFNTAIALIEAIEAQHRAETIGSNIRAAAKAGYDISTHMVGMIGKGKIFVEPMDLEQLADFVPEPTS